MSLQVTRISNGIEYGRYNITDGQHLLATINDCTNSKFNGGAKTIKWISDYCWDWNVHVFNHLSLDAESSLSEGNLKSSVFVPNSDSICGEGSSKYLKKQELCLLFNPELSVVRIATEGCTYSLSRELTNVGKLPDIELIIREPDPEQIAIVLRKTKRVPYGTAELSTFLRREVFRGYGS